MLAAMPSRAPESSANIFGEFSLSVDLAAVIVTPVPTHVRGSPNGDTGRDNISRFPDWNTVSPWGEAPFVALEGCGAIGCGTKEFKSSISMSLSSSPVLSASQAWSSLVFGATVACDDEVGAADAIRGEGDEEHEDEEKEEASNSAHSRVPNNPEDSLWIFNPNGEFMNSNPETRSAVLVISLVISPAAEVAEKLAMG
jgi:hypothetical protein